MTPRRWCYVDLDYISGPEQINVRSIAETIRKLSGTRLLYWDLNYPHLSKCEMTVDEFYEFRLGLRDASLPVDLFFHADDMFELPLRGTRLSERIKRRLGAKRYERPRHYARSHFNDARRLYDTQSAGGIDSFTRNDQRTLERVMWFRGVILDGLATGRRLRFLRAGLEMAVDLNERHRIIHELLGGAVAAIHTDQQLDDVERECTLSPLLRESCRSVPTHDCRWTNEHAARWNEIVSVPI